MIIYTVKLKLYSLELQCKISNYLSFFNLAFLDNFGLCHSLLII